MLVKVRDIDKNTMINGDHYLSVVGLLGEGLFNGTEV
jgi:hypothetical protein